MTKLIDLIHKILIKHIDILDILTNISELILLVYCSNERAGNTFRVTY
jgi:hypothetical protein